eukprot:jgi/Chlat1/6006/Chrsp4S06319
MACVATASAVWAPPPCAVSTLRCEARRSVVPKLAGAEPQRRMWRRAQPNTGPQPTLTGAGVWSNKHRVRKTLAQNPNATPGEKAGMQEDNITAEQQRDFETNQLPPSSPSSADRLLQRGLWAATAAYLGYLIFSPWAPGDAVWAIKWETVQRLGELSLNFFYVMPALSAVGLVDAPVVHPTDEALFNIINAYSIMFAPLLFSDRRNKRSPFNLELLWFGQLFLTNVFLMPYMASRLDPQPTKSEQAPKRLSFMVSGAKYVGLVGAIIGVVSLLWAIYGRPDGNFGDIAARWDYFIHLISTDRVAYAFIYDLVLYAIFQAWLIGAQDDAKMGAWKVMKYVPYFGLAAFLIGRKLNEDES